MNKLQRLQEITRLLKLSNDLHEQILEEFTDYFEHHADEQLVEIDRLLAERKLVNDELTLKLNNWEEDNADIS